MKRKPSTRAQKLNDSNFMQYVEQIIQEMGKAQSIFPEPVPGLGVIESALIAFRLSATEAAYRDTRAVSLRNTRRRELEYLLNELAKYVDTVAQQDSNTILASGFALSKEASSYGGLVPAATRLIAEPQQVGSSRIKLKVDPWQGARVYQFEFRKRGEMTWSTQLSTKSTCFVDGLEMFSEYEFRATYVGIDPRPNYSKVVLSYVV